MKDIEENTNKKITEIPFWVNTKQFFQIANKSELRSKYEISDDRYLVGSFQRDSEGNNPKQPKLIKGPDIYLKIVENIQKQTTEQNTEQRQSKYKVVIEKRQSKYRVVTE